MKNREQLLQELRRQIEQTDSKIIMLLAERAETARQIGRVKADSQSNEKQQLLIKDEAREAQVLQKISSLAAANGLEELFCANLYRQIIDYCVRVQQKDLAR